MSCSFELAGSRKGHTILRMISSSTCTPTSACLQNKEGGKAQGTVGAEHYACLQFGVVPWAMANLRRKADKAGVPFAEYLKDTQQEMAAGMKLPAMVEGQQTCVCLPYWISLDNASVHKLAREQMMQPRVPTEATFNRSSRTLHTAVMLQQTYQGCIERARLGMYDGHSSDPPPFYFNDAERAMHANWALDSDMFPKALAKYATACKSHGLHDVEHPELVRDHITIDPYQYMPLGPKMPDCHSPIEHMIGTIKGYVSRAFNNMDHHNPKLLSLQWYLDQVRDCVRELNGDAAKRHVLGSLQKWKFAVRLVASERSSTIHVHFPKGKYSKRGKGRPIDWDHERNKPKWLNKWENGVAGGWPPAYLC